MKLVRVFQEKQPWPANVLDPQPYLDALPGLSAQLPAGARAFAVDPAHYDFTSVRCVKDLRFASVAVVEGGHAKLKVEIRFEPNKFKHDAGLTVMYDDVIGLAVEAGARGDQRIWPESPKLGDVQLDEILPHDHGCTHEIKLTGGSILVTSGDLHAEWK
jgi:hypothetical protein